MPPSDHPDLLALPRRRYTLVDGDRFPGLTAVDTTVTALGVTRRAVLTHSATAERRFFSRALATLKVRPSEVVTDAAPVYPAVLEELIPSAWHHVERYANNRIEEGRRLARLLRQGVGPGAFMLLPPVSRTEYLWKAAEDLHSTQPGRAGFVARTARDLLEGHTLRVIVDLNSHLDTLTQAGNRTPGCNGPSPTSPRNSPTSNVRNGRRPGACGVHTGRRSLILHPDCRGIGSPAGCPTGRIRSQTNPYASGHSDSAVLDKGQRTVAGPPRSKRRGRWEMYGKFGAVRAAALFASSLQWSQQPTAEQVRLAVTATLRRLGVRGCVTEVAGEFGDHPDVAVARMTWALATVRTTYPATTSARRRAHPLALAS